MKTKSKFLFLFLSFMFLVFAFLGGPQVVFADSKNITPNSKASILIECDSGQVLMEENSNQKLPIASVTKQMTILLALEKIESKELDPQKILTASKYAASMGGSQVFIDANSEYKVIDLLHAIVIASANDASVMIAEEIAGSEEEFVKMMNQRARELGLENTHYTNVTGLPAPMHYSCAKDVAYVLRELTKYPLYFEISGIWMEDFIHPGGRVTNMANTNKLIKFYDGCDAGKTGSTNEAGFCLSATAKRNGMRLISVVLGADSGRNRFKDAASQFDYGFANFESTKVLDKNKNLSCDCILEKAKTNELILCPTEDFSVVNKKGEKANFETHINLPNKIFAPLKKGDIVGNVVITKQGIIQKQIDIIVMQDVQEKSYFEMAKTILQKW